MVDMPVEITRPAVPRSGADKYSVREPLRAIITIWSAVVGRNLVISIRTNRGFANADRNLCGSVPRDSHEKASSKSHESKVFQFFHRFTLSFGPFILRLYLLHLAFQTP